MADQRHTHHTLRINRAPVLTLWAAVVAERLGFAWEEALTLGRAVAGLNAYAKGKALGLFTPTPQDVQAASPGAAREGDAEGGAPAPGRAGDAYRRGLRALSKEKPIDPATAALSHEQIRCCPGRGLRGDAAAASTSASRTGGRGVSSLRTVPTGYSRGHEGVGRDGHIESEAIRQLATEGEAR